MSEQQRENLFNKSIMGAIVGLLCWNVYTTHQLSITIAVLNEKVIQIERTLSNG
jgi:hypothetical protein